MKKTIALARLCLGAAASALAASTDSAISASTAPLYTNIALGGFAVSSTSENIVTNCTANNSVSQPPTGLPRGWFVQKRRHPSGCRLFGKALRGIPSASLSVFQLRSGCVHPVGRPIIHPRQRPSAGSTQNQPRTSARSSRSSLQEIAIFSLLNSSSGRPSTME